MPATPQMLPTMTPLVTEEETGSHHLNEDREITWQIELTKAIRSIPQLCERLGINLPDQVEGAVQTFPVLVPESFLQRMEYGNPADPLLLQILPTAKETLDVAGFGNDPVGDLNARKTPGLLQKYHGRALLMLNGVCAVHCRYCFRRDYPYQDEPGTLQDWEPAFRTIEDDPHLHEVILSGGDPLMMPDSRLFQFIERIAKIPHVTRLRVHSRLPVVLPSRITSGFLQRLCSTRLQPIFVVHANHPAELVADCATALQQIVRAGIPVLNQAVLLRGINDSVDILEQLCERCVDLGVMPYYLHQLDRVSGAAHFEVSQEHGLSLVEKLRERLPGYAVPQYVQEVPEKASKTPLITSMP